MQGRKWEVFSQVWNPVYSSIWEQIDEVVWECVQNNIGFKIRARVWDQYEALPIESITAIGTVKEKS